MTAIPMPSPDQALPGRETAMLIENQHFVHQRPIAGAVPGMKEAVFGMGCFWGAERKFWTLDGVVTTAVGYAGGFTPNPNYREVCSGQTGHAEVVRVVYDPQVVTLNTLLQVFWESHDPTQGMQQGNDRGTQYRSAIYLADAADLQTASESRERFQHSLSAQGFGAITTEIAKARQFYFAETEHQQYLAKNPGGYCGLGGTGVRCG